MGHGVVVRTADGGRRFMTELVAFGTQGIDFTTKLLRPMNAEYFNGLFTAVQRKIIDLHNFAVTRKHDLEGPYYRALAWARKDVKKAIEADGEVCALLECCRRVAEHPTINELRSAVRLWQVVNQCGVLCPGESADTAVMLTSLKFANPGTELLVANLRSAANHKLYVKFQ